MIGIILLTIVSVAVILLGRRWKAATIRAVAERRARKARVLRRLGATHISNTWGRFAVEDAAEEDLDEAIASLGKNVRVRLA